MLHKSPYIIAIDGTSASGKGSISVHLANRFNFAHLDTGKLYRVVAKQALDRKVDPNDVSSILKEIEFINLEFINSTFLHTSAISDYASRIAVHSSIREKLNEFQRKFPSSYKGVVVDGRDIGTVIFPNANLKFFITANVEVRAERRFKQLQNEGKLVEYSAVLKDLKERDYRDTNRKVAPMQAASDAIAIDTSLLDIKSVVQLIFIISSKNVRNYFDFPTNILTTSLSTLKN